MAPRGAFIGTVLSLPLVTAVNAHNLVGCEAFCYDGSDDPQFALQLRHLATGLISFEVCDVHPVSAEGVWGGPCASAQFNGAAGSGVLEGMLTLQGDCGEPIATVTSCCFVFKDLLIESRVPSSFALASLNLTARSATSCDFGDDPEITVTYRIDDMQTGATYQVDHLHAAIGGGLLDLTTEPIHLPVGRPLRLSIAAGIWGTAGFESMAECIARWTMTLADHGPVMNLPAGWTLSSAQGSIVDNQWMPCPTDLDGSDVVDVVDLLQLLTAWGTAGPGATIAPPDTAVDVADLLGLLAAWGPC